MEDFVVLYGHFVYFTAILYILRPFVIHILRVIWFIFPRSGIGIVPRNIWQPCWLWPQRGAEVLVKWGATPLELKTLVFIKIRWLFIFYGLGFDPMNTKKRNYPVFYRRRYNLLFPTWVMTALSIKFFHVGGCLKSLQSDFTHPTIPAHRLLPIKPSLQF
jgi:hypothetical protein